VCSRSFSVDRCGWLRRRFFDLHQAGWFRQALTMSFAAVYKDPSSVSLYSFAFFGPFQHVEWCLHADAVEEQSLVVGQIKILSNSMMNDICAFVTALVKHLWEHLAALEAQYSPIEAVRRVERAILQRHNTAAAAALTASSDEGAATAAEALPGSESEHWALQSIEKLILLRTHIAQIVTAASAAQPISVCDRTYNIGSILQKLFADLFREKLHAVFELSSTRAGSAAALARPSIAVSKLMAGCRATQFALNFIDSALGVGASRMSFSSIVRDVFFQECGNNVSSISPPGAPTPICTPIPSVRVGDKSGHSLIFKLTSFFVEMTRTVATRGSGLVWSPSLRTFVSAGSRRLLARGESAAASSTPSVELYLDPEELKSLVQVIGIQGARCVESHLLGLVDNQVRNHRWCV
jgi:hypothetical protein